jgi:hypothetical protein
MAPHLFDDNTLTDSAYVRSPHKTAYYVRDDGVLLGVTYMPEHEVVAWHQHTPRRVLRVDRRGEGGHGSSRCTRWSAHGQRAHGALHRALQHTRRFQPRPTRSSSTPA